MLYVEQFLENVYIQITRYDVNLTQLPAGHVLQNTGPTSALPLVCTLGEFNTNIDCTIII